MEELYYQKSSVLPPHHTSRILVVGGAMLIIIVGVLVVIFWDRLASLSPAGPSSTSQEVPQKIYTPEEKTQILKSLQQDSSADASAQIPPTTPQERTEILQQLNTTEPEKAASQPSAEERMKLLQSF